MKPLILLRAKNGFVAFEFDGPIPSCPTEEMNIFQKLESSASYRSDGLLAFVEEHFSKPEADPA